MDVLLCIASMVLEGRYIDANFLLNVRLSSPWTRSPVLVAMAFREAGMNPQESIDFVRSRRRGSFNVRQLEFLQSYQSKRRLSDKHVGCLLM